MDALFLLMWLLLRRGAEVREPRIGSQFVGAVSSVETVLRRLARVHARVRSKSPVRRNRLLLALADVRAAGRRTLLSQQVLVEKELISEPLQSTEFL